MSATAALDFARSLAERSLSGQLDAESARRVLVDESLPLLPLAQAAFEVRERYFGRGVRVHVINNAQNGHCPEDCSYCSQAKTSQVDIEKYAPKEEEEVLEEARRAHEAGAHRYCMVFAGRGPSAGRVQKLARMVSRIKAAYDIEVCVSAGLLDEEKARVLEAAGLDRYNHNLNTSEARYDRICTTHSFADRLRTVRAAKAAGLEVCSGMIVGMGESPEEVVEVAQTLARVEAASVPVNFLLPFDGTPIEPAASLTPAYCLRVLCMFRLTNPRAEVRIAAGREVHLRSLQALALYPANSLFLEGYLNSTGARPEDTLQMIRDAGFDVVSDFALDELIERARAGASSRGVVPVHALKSKRDLRPALG